MDSLLIFKEGLSFEQACFLKPVKLGRVRFDKELDFWRSSFCQRLVVGNETQFKKIDFNNTKFKGDISLRKFTLESNAVLQFKEAQLIDGSLEIEDLILNRELDLSGMEFDKKNHLLKLARVDIGLVNLDYQFFVLDTTEMTESRVQYTYEQLVSSQREYGYIEGLKKADIEYQRYKLQNKTLGPFRDFIQTAWWNYGYAKFRVLWFTLGFIIAFSLINVFCLHKLVEIYPLEPITKMVASDEKSKGMKLWFSLVYTTSLFVNINLELRKLNLRNLWCMYIFIIYGLGLICMAFILHYVLFI